ncbi:MAG: sulfatase [Planctomycetes bacterium]|nr:sulfatase [Planctomycetota bacterium]
MSHPSSHPSLSPLATAAWRGARTGAALGAAATLAWALLGARRDGYLHGGLLDLAWHALARRLASGRLEVATLALALFGGGLALATVRLAAPLRLALRALLLGGAAAVATTGAWIAPDEVTPAAAGLRALLLHGALAAAFAGVAALLSWRLPKLRRPWPAVIALAPWFAGFVVARFDREAIVPQTGPQPGIVLLSIDTLRADRLGCYGYARDTTPELDAFAATAVRFADVAAPFPFTLSSHGTLLTGLDPAAHGGTLLGQRVDQRQPLFRDVPTLAEAFRAAGWLTIGLVDTCLWMQPGYGLERGFDLWRNVPGDAAAKRAELATVLRDLRGRKAFLFLHVFDVHSDNRRLPYDRAPEDAGRYSGGYAGPFDGRDPTDPSIAASKLLRHWNDTNAPLDEALVRHVSDLYDEGVRSCDREVGELLQLLREGGFLDAGAVAITSDHGEEFREHGRFMHDTQLFVESLHVPLLLRLPGGSSGGRVVATPAGLLDVAPTLAAIAGVTLPPVQGRSLLAALDAPDDELVPLFFGAEPDEEAVRLGRFKLLKQGESFALYDLADDPREQRDVAADHPDIVEALARRLELRRAENSALAAPRRRDGSHAPSAAQVRDMGAIGYGQ